MNQPFDINQLLGKATWTIEEKEWLLNFLEHSDSGDDELKAIMQRLYNENLESAKQLDPAISARILSQIHEKTGIQPKPQKPKLIYMRIFKIAAACMLLFAGTYFFTVQFKKGPSSGNIANANKKDVNPGGNKAFLTLADGSVIVLQDAQNGTLTQQGNTLVVKQNGKLDYDMLGPGSSETLYNTISTPRGGQYQVELPDGSKVWLNAASSLRFPTAFDGKERRVTVTGEAYFEVAKNKDKPFIVSVTGSEIQVLGTHFNVMAYDDEHELKTTLLEGQVKFVNGDDNALLHPGQQAQLTANGKITTVSNVDLDRVVAWKNGFFDFEGSDFESMAKQLSRWYDVEVVYTKKIDDLFYAQVPRNTKLSDLLKALELTGKVRFEIGDKKIIVKP